MTLPEHDVLVSNIIEVYSRASAGQRVDGRAWYRTAQRIIEALSDVTATDPTRFAHALAALSPRNPWRWNVQDAYAFASAAANNLPMPGNATTFKRNQANAWCALTTDGDPWKHEALKVRNFVAACLGNYYAVVIDVWAYRVAVGTTPRHITKGEYKALVSAYTEAAMTSGELPAHMQAITWIVAQSEGHGQGRRANRNGFKKGTASIVVAAMENA